MSLFEHNNDEADSPVFPLADAANHTILMHRDVHFGGKFEFMLEYYRNEGKGMLEEISVPSIEALEKQEIGLNSDLAVTLLTGAEIERIGQAKEAYQKLRDLYENPTPENRHMRLLADLILAEDLEPQAEINAIVAERSAMVPALIELLRSEDYYDPLFPGYGLAPSLAAICLGKIGDKRAMYSLFESIGEGDFFNEDIALHALKLIGDPAKQFLLKVLHNLPITMDNERAAIALEEFKDDPEVATACFNLLKEIDLKKNQVFATYLILACEGINETPHKKEFESLSKDETIPKSIRQDIHLIVNKWKN